MIQPDFNLLLWVLLITYTIGAISSIILGAMNTEKNQKYGVGDVVKGIIELILIAWVMVK